MSTPLNGKLYHQLEETERQVSDTGHQVQHSDTSVPRPSGLVPYYWLPGSAFARSAWKRVLPRLNVVSGPFWAAGIAVLCLNRET